MEEIVCPFYGELMKAREQIRQQGLSIKALQKEVRDQAMTIGKLQHKLGEGSSIRRSCDVKDIAGF
jgi:hypothetical protein